MAKRILLVDDDKLFRDFFVLLLKNAGIVIDTADHGEEALNKLKDFTYDLVVSDINMPRLNGIDLYQRAVKTYPYLIDKFILITGAIPSNLNTLSAMKNRIIEKSCIDEILEKVRQKLA